MKKNKYLIKPDISNDLLTKKIIGVDQNSNLIETKVIKEKALTIFLNNQEIVTLMSIGDYPKYLAIGYLLNQNMLKKILRGRLFFVNMFMQWVIVWVIFKTIGIPLKNMMNCKEDLFGTG